MLDSTIVDRLDCATNPSSPLNSRSAFDRNRKEIRATNVEWPAVGVVEVRPHSSDCLSIRTSSDSVHYSLADWSPADWMANCFVDYFADCLLLVN